MFMTVASGDCMRGDVARPTVDDPTCRLVDEEEEKNTGAET
jgi:hypothetical protein